tara:strand:- start:19 stop:858 length:840 start_codon:yes stop_codon:yes gene_type:complete
MYNKLITRPLINSPIISSTNFRRTTIPTASIQDLSIGIPLNIFSNIYTNLHYGYDILTPKLIILQFLLGYYSYGFDRFKDALEYKYSNDTSIYPNKKIELYNNILKDINQQYLFLISSLVGSVYLLAIDDYNVTHLPFLFILYLASTYKEYKTKLSTYKPLYISLLWTITSVIMPSVLHDNNYNILLDIEDYIPCILFIFSASNFADINDIEEDRKLNVQTIPVKYGKQVTAYISFAAVAIASIILVENPNFENRFWINTILESQHVGLMYFIYNSTKF